MHLQHLTPTARPLVADALGCAPTDLDRLTAHVTALDLISTVARSPSPAARAALTALTGRQVTICPPRTCALDPLSRGGLRLKPAYEPEHKRGSRPRSRSARRDPRVIVHVEPNPCVPGTGHHLRYQCYAVGLTVDEVVARGATRGDVRWDAARGHLRLECPPR